MLFLIAIHLHSNNMSAIADLVSSTLGMKSGIKANALSRLRAIFTQEIFTEQVITSHAVKVPVTDNLNATMTGYLPINSIYQLLKSRSFSKHKVPIKDWIYNQICHCSCPLHPLVPSLIEVYVSSVVLKSSKTDHLNEPITDMEILNIYKDSVFHWTKKDDSKGSRMDPARKENNLAPHLVMLYYVMLYEDTVINNMKTIVMANRDPKHNLTSTPPQTPKSYPDSLLAQIPINYLLKKAQEEQPQYAGLFSPLLRLLVTHYPHLCAIEDWLEESYVTGVTQADNTQYSDTECTVETFRDALGQMVSCPGRMMTQLHSMLALPVQELLPFSDIIMEALPLMIREEVPRRIKDLIKRIWFLLHSVTPRSLRLGTVNSLRNTETSLYTVAPYTENDVTVDPLIVLRCDDRVFRCAPLLEVVLRVLAAYMQACKVYLHNHMQKNPILEQAQNEQERRDLKKIEQNQAEQDRRDLKNALVATQESAIIQILLECCLPRGKEKEDDSLLSDRREVQCIICTFIHQMFISDPNLAKLVHFQGYPEELLPITTARIPSIHICLDFIPEILSQPQLEKQIFAIKMMSYLCCQFALPKSLSVAKLSVNVMFTMLGVLEKPDRVNFFMETIPCLVRVCQAFPPLCEDVTSLLHQVGRVCTSHVAESSNLLQYDNRETDITDSDLVLGSKFNEKSSKLSKVESAVKNLSVGKKNSELSSKYRILYGLVQKTFGEIVKESLVTKNIYL
ncbi:hypothetical protein FSP39_013249 [Pinctada imbricata]|uniref:Integrator complex subunit 2 n=1 Tax=Pinctada imbricata TaxID=66713 RepID=A0AA88XWI4_PINIB|nr:hypothetical protein FSP39_013249 [Pinctada imbricata]